MILRGANAIVITVLFALLNTGCFVITSHHVSKPLGSAEAAEFHHPPQDDRYGWYVHHFRSSDFDLDTSVYNNTERLQIGFLFWVLPVPFFETQTRPEFEIGTDLWPKNKTLLLDPWRFEYIPGNKAPVKPSKILRFEAGSWKPLGRGQLPVSKPESLTIHFDAPADPDLPFKLRISGVSTAEETNFTYTIDFQGSRIIRAGFILPY
jgi:hypothetical protein